MGLIRETEIPPKPTLSVDMAEYRKMQKLMVKVQDEARAIKQLMHGELPKLEKQLAETTGLFKGKERKALSERIESMKQEIDRRMDRLPDILKEDGYPDVQAFKRLYDDATSLVEQHNRDLAAWERQVHGGQQTQQAPPEKRVSARNSGIWRRKPSAGMMHGGRNPGTAAMTTTEDAKTEENTAGGPCGAYIETPCKPRTCRAYSLPICQMSTSTGIIYGIEHIFGYLYKVPVQCVISDIASLN